jgi:hypothetical protein
LLLEMREKLRIQISYSGLPRILRRLFYAYLLPPLRADEASG